MDGQRLIDNAGEEERYLKSLLHSFRHGLLSLKERLLEDGKPLVKFPRIWVLALSKADLVPELGDVFKFRDLLIDKVADDIAELRRVLEGLIESEDALSVGEDFVLLSSARFETNKIEVTQRVGVDLVLPMAGMLPFERHIKWVEQRQLGAKVVEELLSGAGALATAMIGKAKFVKVKGVKAPVKGQVGSVKDLLGGLVNRAGVSAAMLTAVKLAGDKLRERNAEARAKHDYMAAVLTGFRVALDDGEREGILLRSRK